MTNGRVLSPGLAVACLLAAAVACRAGDAPGEETLAAHAGDWSVEIRTIGRKTGKPRTATIWFVHEDGIVWVQSGQGGRTNWYRNLLENPEVELAFGDLRVRGHAEPIHDEEETERIHDLFLSKYWTAWVSSWLGRDFGQGEVVRIRLR